MPYKEPTGGVTQAQLGRTCPEFREQRIETSTSCLVRCGALRKTIVLKNVVPGRCSTAKLYEQVFEGLRLHSDSQITLTNQGIIVPKSDS